MEGGKNLRATKGANVANISDARAASAVLSEKALCECKAVAGLEKMKAIDADVPKQQRLV